MVELNKRIFEILIYIDSVLYITAFFGLFFLSSEFNEITIKIIAITFIVACIIAIILASILVKKEMEECQS